MAHAAAVEGESAVETRHAGDDGRNPALVAADDRRPHALPRRIWAPAVARLETGRLSRAGADVALRRHGNLGAARGVARTAVRQPEFARFNQRHDAALA